MSSPTGFRLGFLPSPPVPLPQVTGPKLTPFTPTAHADIEFIRNLGRPNDQDSQVWKVRINKVWTLCSQDGASFLFRVTCTMHHERRSLTDALGHIQLHFHKWEYLESAPAKYLNRPLAKPRSYIDYFDPFNCECRAYGRLKQEKREDLAIKAYGYLLLTLEQEAEVTKRIEGELLDGPQGAHEVLDGDNTWGRWEQHRGHPIRAIVKQLVIDDAEPFGAADIPHLWLDLEELHKLGILVRDVHIGNYLGGKLIDFSRSWTMYHPCLDRIPPSTLQEIRQSDATGLLDLLIAWSNENFTEQVAIPESLEYCAGTMTGDCGHDPRSYDWRKWEKNVRMADGYVAHELFTDWDSRGG